MTAEQIAALAQITALVAASRQAQGLPERVTDPDALARVAVLLASGKKAAGRE